MSYINYHNDFNLNIFCLLSINNHYIVTQRGINETGSVNVSSLPNGKYKDITLAHIKILETKKEITSVKTSIISWSTILMSSNRTTTVSNV